MEILLFWIFAVITVGGAVMVIASRNPVHSVMFLVVTFFTIAGFYVLLGAHFLAAIQVAVYAGAIMVLFLFVVMLLNLKKSEREFSKLPGIKVFGTALAIFFLFEIGFIARNVMTEGEKGGITAEEIASQGNTNLIGKILFTDYLYAFEITSVLLLVAIIGAVVLAKKKLT